MQAARAGYNRTGQGRTGSRNLELGSQKQELRTLKIRVRSGIEALGFSHTRESFVCKGFRTTEQLRSPNTTVEHMAPKRDGWPLIGAWRACLDRALQKINGSHNKLAPSQQVELDTHLI